MLVFLDIDGVMVPAKSWETPEILSDGLPAFSSGATKVLQILIENDTTLVLTTSHKSKYTNEQWKNIFAVRGIQVAHLKVLDDNVTCLSRLGEVLKWLNENSVQEEFIIIDDDKSLNDLPPLFKHKLLLTSPMIGLTNSHLEQIEFILNRKLRTL